MTHTWYPCVDHVMWPIHVTPHSFASLLYIYFAAFEKVRSGTETYPWLRLETFADFNPHLFTTTAFEDITPPLICYPSPMDVTPTVTFYYPHGCFPPSWFVPPLTLHPPGRWRRHQNILAFFFFSLFDTKQTGYRGNMNVKIDLDQPGQWMGTTLLFVKISCW